MVKQYMFLFPLINPKGIQSLKKGVGMHGMCGCGPRPLN